MNLHGIVRGAVTAVNPDIDAVLHRNSGGYTTDAAGVRTPRFETMQGRIQVQGINGKDLQHINQLNLQGNLRTVYLFGNWFGVVRADAKGGDVLQFAESGGCVQDWRIVNVMETWPHWTKVIVCLQ